MTIKFDNGDYIKVSIEEKGNRIGWYRVTRKSGPHKGVSWWNPSDEFRYPMLSSLLGEVSDIVRKGIKELATKQEVTVC